MKINTRNSGLIMLVLSLIVSGVIVFFIYR